MSMSSPKTANVTIPWKGQEAVFEIWGCHEVPYTSTVKCQHWQGPDLAISQYTVQEFYFYVEAILGLHE